MPNIANRIIHPPIWVYLVFSFIILSSMWTGHYYHDLNEINTKNIYPKSAITKIDTGLPKDGWEPIVFADLTREGNIDIIYKQTNTSQFSIYRYTKERRLYHKTQSLLIPGVNIKAMDAVDFGGTGYNDLLITHSENLKPPYHMSVLKNEKGFFYSGLTNLDISSRNVPFIFDFHQNGKFDILYIDHETGKTRLYFNHNKSSSNNNSKNIKKDDINSYDDNNRLNDDNNLEGVLTNYHSIAAAQFRNVPGDDGIDIIAVTECNAICSTITVIGYDRSTGKWKERGRPFLAPPNIGEIAVGDFDGDGYLDIVFPVFPEKKKSTYLCLMFNGADGFYSDTRCTNRTSSMRVDVENIVPGLRPQVGDLTLSGSPDLMVAVRNADSEDRGKPSQLEASSEAETEIETSLQSPSNKTFKTTSKTEKSTKVKKLFKTKKTEKPKKAEKPTEKMSEIEKISDTLSETASTSYSMQLILNQACKTCTLTREMVLVRHSSIDGLGAFFDIFADGALDVVTDKGAFVSTLADVDLISYFLRVSAINGQCLDSCGKGPRYPKPAPLATVYNGATVRIEYTDKNGIKHKSVAAQRSTGGLTLPFCLFGLGENVHYVDEVTVLTTEKDTWTWILPSSKVFTSSKHQIRVFLMYNIYGFYVMFGVICLLLLLGMIVLVYARREDEEDKKEAEEMLPLF